MYYLCTENYCSSHRVEFYPARDELTFLSARSPTWYMYVAYWQWPSDESDNGAVSEADEERRTHNLTSGAVIVKLGAHAALISWPRTSGAGRRLSFASKVRP